ncbi:MAG: CTP synthase [Anaplasmataceae bacterium]|nr:CTP synthase [Anaplasmataceae bacterium]
MARYIFVTGGVMSGIGKGVSTASIARLLKDKGFRVTACKIDPYVNVDAGTMNPLEHGEVFVTEDGLECDQDIGNYERFLDTNIYRDNYMTTGLVYQTVINRERALQYDGKCVQVVPAIPDEVIRRLRTVAQKTKADFVLVEVGGTVGEYENLLFLEAARMMKLKNPKEVLFVLVTYLPIPSKLGEMKTKPTQHAVRNMNTAGIQPDLILARSSVALDGPRKKKIALFCNVDPESIISAPDVDSIYDIPINFEKDGLSKVVLKKFGMKPKITDGRAWRTFVKKVHSVRKPVKIAIAGKYFTIGDFTLSDSYLSVIEAIKHAAWKMGRKPEIHWIDTSVFEKNPARVKDLAKYDGLIVPGGFGSRGTDGKILAIRYAREHKLPFLGLCYGLQLATIEYARNVAKIAKANSTEIDPKTPHPVIDILPEQKENLAQKNLGGSMRLGGYPCELKEGSRARKAYGQKMIIERHRHRFEVNNFYRETLEKKGLIFSGVNPEKNLVEILELKNHPFFMASQFHPELKSRPLSPHPLFVEFIKSSTKN